MSSETCPLAVGPPAPAVGTDSNGSCCHSQALRRRDEVLDVLRGLAVVLMTLSHVGGLTRVAAVAHLPLYFSAAGPFVLLSGFVLGMASKKRLARGGFGGACRKTWARALMLWAIHCALTVGVLCVHEATGRLKAPRVESVGGWGNALAMVSTLQLQPSDYMNILPMYVVFLAAAPLALGAMQGGATWAALLPSLALYAAAQSRPNLLPLPAPLPGESVTFDLAAWQFVFSLGLAAGFHRERLGLAWARNRGWLGPLTAAAAGVLFVAAQLQRETFAPLGAQFSPALASLFGKTNWGPLRGVYCLSLLALLYSFAKRALRRESSPLRAPLLALAEVGRASLYCFLVHLAFALLASGFGTCGWPLWRQEILTVAAAVAVWLMARHRVLARFIPN